jgi:nucleoside-diphosphate-sugar epimerase
MILVTGSLGLIGKKLTEQLTDLNIDFKAMDIKYPKQHHYYGDVCNPVDLNKHLQDIEGIIHLAAVSRVVYGEKQPDLCWLTNTKATYQLLDLAAKLQHKPWIIYASSREIYGRQATLPVQESALSAPVNHYASSKWTAEQMINNFRDHNLLRTQILRFSSVYGSVEDHADRVIPAFCRAAVSSRPIRIDGFENVLDFTHVVDVVEGVIKTIKALRQKKTMPPAIHLTTGRPTTLLQAAQIAIKASGNQSKFIEAPSRHYDVAKFYGDPSMAYQVLDWKAKIPIEKGMQQLVVEFADLIKSTIKEKSDENYKGDTWLSTTL